MEPVGIVAVGAVHGLFVFFKAFQQRNVAFLHYWWVVPTSYAMASADVFIMSMVALRAVQSDTLWSLVPLALSIGTGSMFGALAAMWTHDKYITKGTSEDLRVVAQLPEESARHERGECVAKNSPQENFVATDERACPNCFAPASSIEYSEDVGNYFTDIKIEEGTYCINPDAQAIFWDHATEQRMFCTECDHYFDLDNMEIDFR